MLRRLDYRVIMAFASVYLIWGSTYLAIRFTIETLPPFLTAGLRFTLAGLILYAIVCGLQRHKAPELKHWKSAFIVGAFLLLGGNGSVVFAEHTVPSGLAALLIATTPLWMVLIQWLWQGQKPKPAVWLGIGIGFAGVCFLILPHQLPQTDQPFPLLGVWVLLGAAISWSIGSIYSRQADTPQSPFLATAMQMIAGGILLMLLGLANGELTHYHMAQFSGKSIWAFVYLLFFGSLIGFTSYIWLLKNVGVAKASTYAFVNPMVAVFLGYALAGESFNPSMIIAGLGVVIAVIIIIFNPQDIKNKG